MKRIVIVMVWALGCSGAEKKPAFVAPPPTGPRIVSLFTDSRAAQIGDLVTVQIVENARGSKNNTSKAAKKTDLSLDLKNDGSDSANTSTLGLKTALKTKNNYDSDTGLEKRGSLVANVTATVVEVMPNANLKVHGEQQITLDKGVQTITVSGIVRPDDIGSNNTILSTRLADARITYKSANEPNVHRYGIIGWLFNLVF